MSTLTFFQKVQKKDDRHNFIDTKHQVAFFPDIIIFYCMQFEVRTNEQFGCTG